nr:hypothetical protein Iba_chr09eCG2040 [Ipomoea batatas]GMD38264.1 hypothetical protein Iba_chr09fCG2270 [Ipomoea batatas]
MHLANTMALSSLENSVRWTLLMLHSLKGSIPSYSTCLSMTLHQAGLVSLPGLRSWRRSTLTR